MAHSTTPGPRQGITTVNSARRSRSRPSAWSGSSLSPSRRATPRTSTPTSRGPSASATPTRRRPRPRPPGRIGTIAPRTSTMMEGRRARIASSRRIRRPCRPRRRRPASPSAPPPAPRTCSPRSTGSSRRVRSRRLMASAWRGSTPRTAIVSRRARSASCARRRRRRHPRRAAPNLASAPTAAPTWSRRRSGTSARVRASCPAASAPSAGA